MSILTSSYSVKPRWSRHTWSLDVVFLDENRTTQIASNELFENFYEPGCYSKSRRVLQLAEKQMKVTEILRNLQYKLEKTNIGVPEY